MSKVLIEIVSNSIGDTIAALPYIERYSKDNDVDVVVSINPSLIPLFVDKYQSIQLQGRTISGSFSKIFHLEYDFNSSVQGGYAKQLGYENPEYIRPKLTAPKLPRPIKGKYVTIGIHSTSQLKYWNHPTGKGAQKLSPNWAELCAIIRKAGYTPVVVEQHEMFGQAPNFNGMPAKAQVKLGNMQQSLNLINHSEFYIGLSSGMAWAAHAMGKKVAMIANFTEDWNEFDLNLPDYKRIVNKAVCHGCWNRIKLDFPFDAEDWYWCPKHKDTERQFECHTSITPEMVHAQIKEWLV